MKAMLLAAGRGERLKPLTDTIPKPLVKVGAFTLIEHNIFALESAGITDIVINVCYRAKEIIHALGDGSRYGVKLEYSFEGEEVLGTGGGILRALTLLGDEPFWVVSADVWSKFDFKLSKKAKLSDAHLILVPNPEFHPEGDYGLLADGELTRAAPKFNYGGIAYLRPQLFFGYEPGFFALAPLINAAIVEHKASGEFYSGPWFNIGTLTELHKLQVYLGADQGQDQPFAG